MVVIPRGKRQDRRRPPRANSVSCGGMSLRRNVPAAAFVQDVRPRSGPATPSLITARQVESAHGFRSEEHTSELQSLMRISYAVFCLTKKNTKQHRHTLLL